MTLLRSEGPNLVAQVGPPIRWAGSKRLLLDRLHQYLPRKYSAYFEPMVGSGALFFSLCPSEAYLSDTNAELINFYRVVRRTPKLLFARVSRWRPCQKTYYAVRRMHCRGPISRAARFFFLIRLSWNGLYRVNKLGKFNVPYGGRRPLALISKDRLLTCAKALRPAHLRVCDFAAALQDVHAGDFVYLDPPYPRGASRDNGFARYGEKGFSLADHLRLAQAASDLADRGAHVLVTEAARKEFLDLYSDDFYVSLVRTPSLIAADRAHRRDAYEAILTSYRPLTES